MTRKRIKHNDLPSSRAATVSDSEIDSDARTVTFTAASNDPIWRGWGGIDDFIEVINIRKTDMGWVKSGNAPVLWQHNSDLPIGRIVSGKIIKGQERDTIQITAQFYEGDEESERAWKRIESGMIRNVSIGWSAGVDDYRWEQVEREGGKKDDPPVDLLVFEKIRLKEVSFVSNPADQSVGIGRASSPDEVQWVRNYLMSRAEGESEKETEDDMKDPDDDDKRKDDPEDEGDDAEKDKEDKEDTEDSDKRKGADFNPEGQRYLSDNEARFRSMGINDDGIKALREYVDGDKGRSTKDVQAKAFEFIDESDEKGSGRTGAPEVMKRAGKTFSCGRVLELFGASPAKGIDAIDGLEREVIDEFTRDTKGWAPSRSPVSVMIPHSALLADPVTRNEIMKGIPVERREEFAERFKRAYEVGSTLTGFHHEVFDESFFVEALIAPAKLLSMTTKLPGELVQDLVGVTESGEVTVLHDTEKGTRAESNGLSFGNRTFSWHQIRAMKEITQRTLDQSRFFFPRLLQVLRRDTIRGQNKALIGSLPTAIEHAPTGILNFTSIDTIAIAANGGNPTYEHMVDLYTMIEANNVSADGLCFAMTPEIKGRLQKTPRFTSSQGDSGDKILSGGSPGVMNPNIDGYKVITENNLPKTLTKGTSNDCHAVIFGDFSDIEMGFFSGLEMYLDPYTLMNTNQIRVYLRQAYDFLPRHVDSFAVILDARK